jgi:2-C-methyl-D-erythritol 4-phosphate cytidylyltransferase
MVSAVIFAGGIGQRMKSIDIPKQFLEIEGKPIIVRTMEHFSNHPLVDNIVVVCVESWLDELRRDVEKFGIEKVIAMVPGGNTGYQSIHNGLLEVEKIAQPEDIVLICDGVRPMLSEELITTCIEDARKYESAVPVTPSIDSVLYSEDGENCSKNYERKKMFITQAPQGYTVRKIMWAHGEAEKQHLNPVSSGELLIELGETIHIFQGIRENIKVTTPEDLESLRAIQYYGHYMQFAKEVLKYGL